MHFCKKLIQKINSKENSKTSKPFNPLNFSINPPVFWSSLLVVLTLIVLTISIGKPIEKLFDQIVVTISNKTGWLFILSFNVLLGIYTYLGIGKYGKIKLGGPKAKTDFSTSAWMAMLFSAGMGIGLLFYGVAEPISHFSNSPFNHGSTPIEAAQAAMGTTFMHWGFHIWALYGFVALAIAYFYYNRNLPLSIRSLFYPLLGDKING